METIYNNLDKMIMNENDAMNIFRSIRWANGVFCPKCKSFSIHHRGNHGHSLKYSCKKCNNNFSDFTDTLFEYSKIPFGKMIYILINIGYKSVNQLSKELKLHRNTVGRYHKRIREFLEKNNKNPQFDGELEMDEVYIIAGEKGLKKTLQLKILHEKGL